MKIKKLATLFAIMTIGLGTALAQGTIDFHNANTYAMTAAGTTVGTVGSPVGPASLRIGLFIGGVTATDISQMTMVGLTTNSPSSSGLFAGTFNGTTSYAISGHPAGEVVNFMFAAWSISTGSLVYDPNTAGGWHGLSDVGHNYILGGGGSPPQLPGPTFAPATNLTAIHQGMVLQPNAVPEPSTIVIGLLGAAALLPLLRRNRK